MKIKFWHAPAALLVFAGLAVSTASARAEDSLYSRLGGQQAITAVVEDFLGNVAADARINGRFAKANLPHLKMRLIELIEAGSGGPQKYAGLDMRTAHKAMNIAVPEFNALVEDLVKSLDKFKVPSKEKGELLGILGPMQPDIVGQ